ncbi:IPExxxVDY family protein [Mesonia aestuariivivens]|uniref:IPExxxVDY family protein n=1 Tax=Mesonia aestuariivivens TaxID=2796128 RepID=A0ABS6VX88_9FLAO|nr:IPExxxVDY family protein [Mesonia aestuariivivens]MBW2960217.1 IPExxxVDY family protein [Mesonia aestuariivivens]
MVINKLVLDNLVDEDFHLIAIHCSAEVYKVVFYLNKFLGLNLQRTPKDVDYNYPEGMAFYELYDYYSKDEGFNYYLVSNKYSIKANHLQSNGFLFEGETKKKAYLLPEFKRVDCFLKIEDNSESVITKELLLAISKINQIVTAYTVEVTQMKSIENLIFS